VNRELYIERALLVIHLVFHPRIHRALAPLELSIRVNHSIFSGAHISALLKIKARQHHALSLSVAPERRCVFLPSVSNNILTWGENEKALASKLIFHLPNVSKSPPEKKRPQSRQSFFDLMCIGIECCCG
jgi:hypothetical protein